MKGRIATALATLMGLAGAHGMALFEDNEFVKVIDNKKALQAEVLSSSRAVLLGAFSDDAQECEGCGPVSKEFKKAAETLSGYGVQSVAVDCTGALPKCHGMTQLLGLNHLPGILGFTAPPVPNPYTRKPDRAKLPFEGAANARGLQKHVLNNLPSSLLPRQTKATLPASLYRDSTSAKKKLVLLFTDRDSTSPLYKALAHHYGPDRLQFAEVSSEEEGLAEDFGVSSFPTLLVASRAGSAEPVAFEGSLKDWKELTSFLDAHALAPDDDDDEEEEAGGDTADGDAGGGGGKKSKGDGKKKLQEAAAAAAKGLVATRGGSVSVGSAQELEETLKHSAEAWLVLFHSVGSDGAAEAAKGGVGGAGGGVGSADVQEAWSQVSRKCEQGLVSAAEVNCSSSEASQALCSQRKVKFSKKGPAAVVHVYGYGDKSGDDDDEEEDVMGGGASGGGAVGAGEGQLVGVFEASTESDDAFAAAGDSLPDLTYKVNAMTLDGVMAEASKTDSVVLVLISNKGEPPSMLKQLALTLQPAVVVCFFPDPDPQTLQRFQVSRTPMFLALFAQAADEEGSKVEKSGKEIAFGIQHFEPKRFGRPTFESVFSFALQTSGSINPEVAQTVVDREQDKIDAIQAGGKTKLARKASDSGGGQRSSSSSVQSESGPIPEVTADEWESLCKPTSATLCAIAFLSGPKESPAFESEMAALVAAREARTKDPYVFMWADANCLTSFADAFDVQPSKVPTVVAFSPKKSRFASFIGVYGEEAINDLLTGVLSGRVKTNTLYQAAAPDTGKDCAALFAASQAAGQAAGGLAGDSGGGVEEEEDLGDMMAEILAEEARAKAALQAEVEADAKAEKEAALAAAAAEEAALAAKAKKKKAAKKKAAKKKKGKKDNEL